MVAHYQRALEQFDQRNGFDVELLCAVLGQKRIVRDHPYREVGKQLPKASADLAETDETYRFTEDAAARKRPGLVGFHVVVLAGGAEITPQ